MDVALIQCLRYRFLVSIYRFREELLRGPDDPVGLRIVLVRRDRVLPFLHDLLIRNPAGAMVPVIYLFIYIKSELSQMDEICEKVIPGTEGIHRI